MSLAYPDVCQKEIQETGPLQIDRVYIIQYIETLFSFLKYFILHLFLLFFFFFKQYLGLFQSSEWSSLKKDESVPPHFQ